MTEAELLGLPVNDEAAMDAALEAMSEDFQPLDDMRASAAYRLEAAIALVAKAITEIAGTSSATTRVFGRRADAHIA
jgi:xanthine dehydrogenase small subunit